MNILPFEWSESTSLATELARPLKQISVESEPHGWPMFVTLWRSDGTGLRVRSAGDSRGALNRNRPRTNQIANPRDGTYPAAHTPISPVDLAPRWRSGTLRCLFQRICNTWKNFLQSPLVDGRGQREGSFATDMNPIVGACQMEVCGQRDMRNLRSRS